MGCGAGPRPRLSLGHQARTHWIELCIAQGLPQVRLVQRAGIVPPLPDMTTGVMDGIPIRSIPAVGVLQRQAQDIRFRRDGKGRLPSGKAQGQSPNLLVGGLHRLRQAGGRSQFKVQVVMLDPFDLRQLFLVI